MMKNATQAAKAISAKISNATTADFKDLDLFITKYHLIKNIVLLAHVEKQ